jgi:hypothetical protein
MVHALSIGDEIDRKRTKRAENARDKDHHRTQGQGLDNAGSFQRDARDIRGSINRGESSPVKMKSD